MAKEREKYKAQGVIEAGLREPALEHTGLKEDAMFFVQGPVVAIRWQMAAHWPVSYVSPNIRAFGYQPADFVEGRVLYADIIQKEDLPRVMVEVKTYLEENRRYYEQDYRIRCANGEIRWVHDFTTVVRDAQDTVIHLDGYIADITELRRAQEDLAQSEMRYRRIVELAHEGIWIMSARFQTTFVNKRMADLLGYTEDEMQGRDVTAFMPEQELSDHARRMVERKGGHAEQYERRLQRKDGSIRTFLVNATPVFGEHERFAGSFAMFSDITDRKEAESALRLERDRAQLYLEIAKIIFVALDLEGNITMLNGHAREILGCDDSAVGKNWFETFVPEDQREQAFGIFKALIDGHVEPYSYGENVILTHGGEIRTIAWHNTCLRDSQGAIQGTLSSGEDITSRLKAQEEQHKLEAQMRHMQKLESLGVLAGGIAHDFNNLLVGILGNADLALNDLPALSPARECIVEIASNAKKAADLARQMLAYSGRGKFVVESVNLNEAIEEMRPLLETTIAGKTAIKYNYAKSLPSIDADLAQLRQLFMNLVINASEALTGPNGIVTISTGNMECDQSYLASNVIQDILPSGPYVFLEVADAGCGMDRATMDRIFEPFYTTKFTGRGLGLSAVLGIVRGHHGAIKVYSEEGKGSTFKILFPISITGAQPLRREKQAPRRFDNGGHVLLVDDESTVRDVGRRMLERFGFTVLLASDGFEALEVFRQHQDTIRCVLLDLTMPGMDGEETFRELRRLQPTVCVVLSSGYNEQDVTQRFSGKGLAGFIQKPYSLNVLMETLEKILND